MKVMISKGAFFSICFFSIILIFSTNSLCSQKTKIKIAKEDAVLRLKPNSESMIIETLPVGSKFFVEDTLDEWIKISLPPDKEDIVITGYVHRSFVVFEEELITREIVQKNELTAEETYNDIILWRKKLDSAKAKKKLGDILDNIGFAISVLGGVLLYADKKEVIDESYDWETRIQTTTTTYKGKTEYLLFSIGGIIVSAAGYLVSKPAKNKIRILELEGAMKGYIKVGLVPIKGGGIFQLTFSF